MTTRQNQTVDILGTQLFMAIFRAVVIAVGLFSIFYLTYYVEEKQKSQHKKELTQKQKDEEQQRMLTSIIFLAG